MVLIHTDAKEMKVTVHIFLNLDKTNGFVHAYAPAEGGC